MGNFSDWCVFEPTVVDTVLKIKKAERQTHIPI